MVIRIQGVVLCKNSMTSWDPMGPNGPNDTQEHLCP